MKVYAFESTDWAETERNGISAIAAIASIERGLSETKKLLPTLSDRLNIVIRPYFQHIMPEYGTGARTWDSEFIEIWLDKQVPHGAEKTLESIYQTVFHEGHHAARWNIKALGYDDRAIAGAIFEGSATVFERERAGYRPLYGEYEDDETMQLWFNELAKAGSLNSKTTTELFFDHPDGRRWVGYKTGAWLVDKAIERSGKEIEQLIDLPVDNIVALAELSGIVA